MQWSYIMRPHFSPHFQQHIGFEMGAFSTWTCVVCYFQIWYTNQRATDIKIMTILSYIWPSFRVDKDTQSYTCPCTFPPNKSIMMRFISQTECCLCAWLLKSACILLMCTILQSLPLNGIFYENSFLNLWVNGSVEVSAGKNNYAARKRMLWNKKCSLLCHWNDAHNYH